MTIDRYYSVIVSAQGSVCRTDDVGMNNPPEKISARLFKIITEASNDSVLIRYKHDNSLDVINSLAALDALENKMEVDVLISPAGPWANNIVAEVTADAMENDESTHAATLRSKAVKRANAEIERNEQRSNPFHIPPDVIGGGQMKRYEVRLWLHLINQMIPLLP